MLRPLARDRVTVARAALRAVLAGYTGLAAQAIALSLGPVGKPHLASAAGPQFNLSHSRDVAVVAVTARRAVGVDVEAIGRRLSQTLIRRTLTPAELATVQALAPEAHDEGFLRHWTAKEAYVKATGEGLSGGVSTVGIVDALGAPQPAGRPGRAYLRRLDHVRAWWARSRSPAVRSACGSTARRRDTRALARPATAFPPLRGGLSSGPARARERARRILSAMNVSQRGRSHR